MCDDVSDCPASEDELECVRLFPYIDLTTTMDNLHSVPESGLVAIRLKNRWHFGCFDLHMSQSAIDTLSMEMCQRMGYGALEWANLAPIRDQNISVKVDGFASFPLNEDFIFLQQFEPIESCRNQMVK